MPYMDVTALVFQPLMFWLKAAALQNIENMVATAPVFQSLMFWLKTSFETNLKPMLLTALVSKVLIAHSLATSAKYRSNPCSKLVVLFV